MKSRASSAAAALALALALAASPVKGQASKTAPASASDAVFAAWDTDHDGMLSRAEFDRAWEGLRERAEARVESRLREQFDKVDANRNGAVDAGEYGHLVLVQRAGKSAPPLSAFDADHDGRLAFGEYLTLVGRLAATARAPGGKSP